MAEDIAVIASAVVASDQELDQTEVPRVTKRRQSSSPDPSTKRPRLSTDGDLDSPSTIRATPNVSPLTADTSNPPKDSNLERRKSNAQEERTRGRRLFGGLLNTLSQTTSNAQQKKRLEIEKRQQEKVRLQKAEDESRRTERLQKLKEVRIREQVKFDEQSMRIRHSNMLAMAQFLCTKAEPKLYYKPWELLPGDAQRMQQQIADAEALIDHEIQEFNERHKTELRAEERPRERTKNSAVETEGEHHAESSPVPLPPVASSDSESTNPITLVQVPQTMSGSVPVPVIAEREPLEDNGEVVVEGDEDTVIY